MIKLGKHINWGGKLKGSAIYYALFLSIIFGLLLGGLILFSGFNQRLALQMDIEKILIANANSGIVYGQANFNELPVNQVKQIRLFNEGVDSVAIEKKQWGAFTIIKSTAIHRNRNYTKIALMGASNLNEQANLYLVDNGRPISLCGEARLEGVCKLPKAGLKSAYIAGQNYQGGKLLYGTSSQSQKQLPALEQAQITQLTQLPGDLLPFSVLEDSIVNSFKEKTKHLVSEGVEYMDNLVIQGNVVIDVRDSIFINHSTTIENAIIKSKVVYIESGFSGTAQIFATEKIILEPNVQLKYPSVLLVAESVYPTITNSQLTIGGGSQVLGSVLMLTTAPNFRKLPTLNIETNAEVDGFVYCQGKVQLKGTIKGHLFAQKLYLKTASAAYENHLLDGKLLNTLPAAFITPCFLKSTEYLAQISWLN